MAASVPSSDKNHKLKSMEIRTSTPPTNMETRNDPTHAPRPPTSTTNRSASRRFHKVRRQRTNPCSDGQSITGLNSKNVDPTELHIDIPSDELTSDEDIRRLTTRDHGSSKKDTNWSTAESESENLDISELEAVRASANREVDLLLSENSFILEVCPTSSENEPEMTNNHLSEIDNDELPLPPPQESIPKPDTKYEVLEHSASSIDEYIHLFPRLPLPQKLEGSSRRHVSFRKYKQDHISGVSKQLKRFTQYQHIWADIYDEHDINERSFENPTGEEKTLSFVCPMLQHGKWISEASDAVDIGIASKMEAATVVDNIICQNIPKIKECMTTESINASLDCASWTPLHYAACLSNNITLCKTLLSYGAGVTIEDCVQRWSPLQISVLCNKNPDVLKLMLGSTSTPNVTLAKTDRQGRTVLHLCLLKPRRLLLSGEFDEMMNEQTYTTAHRKLLLGECSDSKRECLKLALKNAKSAIKRPIMSKARHKKVDAFVEESMLMLNSPESCSDHEMYGQAISEHSSGPASGPDDCSANMIDEPSVSDPKYPYPIADGQTLEYESDKSHNGIPRQTWCTISESGSESSSLDEIAILSTFDLGPELSLYENRADEDEEAKTLYMFHFLLERGADIQSLDRHGNTILHYAVRAGHHIIASEIAHECAWMLNAGNQEHQTPLHIAAVSGHCQLITTLLDRGSSPQRRDIYGNRPLDLFITEHFQDSHSPVDIVAKPKIQLSVVRTVIEKFFEQDILISKTTNLQRLLMNMPPNILEDMVNKNPGLFNFKGQTDKKQTLLHAIAKIPRNIHAVGLLPMKIRFLVNQGVCVNSRDINGRTSLHFACWNRNEEMVDILLKLEADVHIQDSGGRTPLHNMLMKYSPACDVYNLENNDYDDVRQTQIIDSLLKHKSDINAADENGRAPLHVAIQNSNLAIVEYLLSKGANIDQLDMYSLSPEIYAVKFHRNDLFAMISNQKHDGKHKSTEQRRACKDLPPFVGAVIPATHAIQRGNVESMLNEHLSLRGKNRNFVRSLLRSEGIGRIIVVGENAMIQSEMNILIKRLSEAVGKQEPYFQFHHQLVGSAKENTKTGLMNQFDFIFNLTEFNKKFMGIKPNNALEEGENSLLMSLWKYPGLEKDATENFLQKFIDREGILHATPLSIVFMSTVFGSLSSCTIWEGLHMQWEDSRVDDDDGDVSTCQIHVRWTGPMFTDMIIEINIIPSIEIEHPIHATDATRRDPSHSLGRNISEISKRMVLLKWGNGFHRDTVFHVSCSEEENQLFQSLPDIVMDVFCLVKVVNLTELAQQFGGPMETYLLKTVLLWLLFPEGTSTSGPVTSWIMCSELPPTDSELYLDFVRHGAHYIYNRVEDHLTAGYLSSFFNEGYNILDDLTNRKHANSVCHVAKLLLSK